MKSVPWNWQAAHMHGEEGCSARCGQRVRLPGTKAACRLLFVLLPLLCVDPARAEWLRVTKTDGTAIYIAPTAISRKNHYQRVWQLHDYRTPDENGDRSARVLTEFDCRNGRVRSLQWAFFRGPMGSREMTAWRSKPEDWMEVGPGTVGEAVGKLVCDG
jgi:hypothetical protein